MRVKFNNAIYLCNKVTHREGSELLLFTTSNGVYTVHTDSSENAQKIYNNMLSDGYFDMSEYEYSN